MRRVPLSPRFVLRRSFMPDIHIILTSLTAAEAVELYMSITTADGLKTVQEPMKGDPLVSARCGPVRSHA